MLSGQEFIQSSQSRLLSWKTNREDGEERLEELENPRIRIERAHLEHQERLNRMDEQIQRQDRLIELFTRHLTTDPPVGELFKHR
jgi:hypothetical protein